MSVKISKKFLILRENYVNLMIFQLKKTHFIVVINYSIFVVITQKYQNLKDLKNLKFIDKIGF
jgi:hypothetical protein